MPRIPAFDLRRAVGPLARQITERWSALLADTAFVGGPEVEHFERSWTDFLGAAGCVGVANGTDALVLALRALDVEPGDEVVVPSFTFIATAAAVAMLGARPVFADVEAETLNLDAASLEAAIGDRTVGVIAVHLYGRPCDLDGLTRVCRDRGVWLLEDAAQAHGASWRGIRVGSFGRLATWSFYPSKNLGCFGDGGAVTGGESAALERVRRLANHGRIEHYLHSEVGSNSRLDALQAAVLNCRLPRLEADNSRRRELAQRYRRSLSHIEGLELLADRPQAQCVYHQMTVLCRRRDELRRHLLERGIGTAVHYPVALHRQPAFAELAPAAETLPVASTAGDRVLCLPMFPQLTDAEVDEVCEAVRSFFG